MSFAIRVLGRQKLPRIAWERIKNNILLGRYELSLVFADSKRMKALNLAYRKKNTTTNVLAFPLGKNEGEIFMDLAVAKREALAQAIPYNAYVLHLYIHALLHLKGFDHETERERIRMNKEENKWLKALQ